MRFRGVKESLYGGSIVLGESLLMLRAAVAAVLRVCGIQCFFGGEDSEGQHASENASFEMERRRSKLRKLFRRRMWPSRCECFQRANV